jgi:pilus assembly protein FimV
MFFIAIGQTYALGVSEIELISKLGEPLSARLQLLDAGDLGADEIIVRQAPTEIYQQLGVDARARLIDLKFNLSAEKVLQVSTHAPIKEPFLNFVLEFHWPEGRLYREYKLLIDL